MEKISGRRCATRIRVARWFVFKPKISIWVNLERKWNVTENVVIFYDHLAHFSIIWYNLWPFGIVCGHFVYFSRFGMFGPRKYWQPWLGFWSFNRHGAHFLTVTKNFRRLRWNLSPRRNVHPFIHPKGWTLSTS
jgi:hypothetical protein